MTVPIISFMVAMALGQRFTVLILVPATTMGLAVAIGYTLAIGDNLLSVALTAAATLASIDVGYLLGVGLRHLLAQS